MEINGTWYHQDTPKAVIDVLENARSSGQRIRVHYGDVKTGKDWMDEYDVTGTIGRSTGSQKIPLMIANSRSSGGPGLLEHCIVKIRTAAGNRVLYQHPTYHAGTFTVGPAVLRADAPRQVRSLTVAVYRDGEIQAQFKTRAGLDRWARSFGFDAKEWQPHA